MLDHFKRWVAGSRRRQACVVAACVAMLSVGGWLMARTWYHPAPPPVASLDDGELIDYLGSGRFERATLAQREAFLDGAASRYLSMTPDERRRFEDDWRAAGLDGQTRRRIEAQMDLALACRMAEEYAALTPESRDAFLDRMLFMIRTMSGGDDFLEWMASNPMQDAIRDPSLVRDDPGSFKLKLLLATDADQRAGLSQLGGDLLKRARRYR